MKTVKRFLPYLDQMLVSGSHFLIGILLARALGVEAYGTFALIWMGVLFVSSIHQSLIVLPAMTFAGKNDKEMYSNNLWGMQLLFAVVAFLSVILVLQIGRFFLPEWNQFYLIYLFPFLSVLYVFHDFFRKQFYIENNIQQAFMMDILAYLPQIVGIGILFFLKKLTLGNAIGMIVGSYCLSSVVAFLLMENKKIKKNGFVESLHQHWRFSKWLTGKALLQWFSGNIFIIAAGAILGTGAVGMIRMAQNVTGIFNIFFLTLENSIPVKASKIFNEKGFAQLTDYLTKITIKGTVLLGGSIGIIIVFAEPIIQLLYGSQPVETISVFRGFMLFTLLVFWAIPLRFAIRTIEATRAIFIAYVLSAIIGILLAYPLINKFEIWGVLLGLMLTQVVTHLYYLYALKGIANQRQMKKQSLSLKEI